VQTSANQPDHGHDALEAAESAHPTGSIGTAIRSVPTMLAAVPPISRDRLKQEVTDRFRMPGTADPKVQLRRLAGVATWAALLGFGGLVTVARIVIGLFTTAPGWYLPTMCGIGLFGIACTVGGFASVHRRRTPWILLGVATATLVVGWVVDFSR
jgi:hypothetical protein